MKKNILLLFLMFFVTSITLSAQESSLVSIGSDGRLDYTTFAMQGQSNEVNIIPDYSHAGYMGGGVALPNVSVVRTLSPASGDRLADIQQAIDEVSALPSDGNGFRGAILLTAGLYEVSNSLLINTSGVVLRGEGQGLDGTVLRATRTSRHDFIRLRGNTENASDPIIENASTTQRITTSYVPLGSTSFNIANASAFSVGDVISVKRTPNQLWINDIGMDQSSLCDSAPSGRTCEGWTPEEYIMKHERIITAISNNTITIDIPIMDVMENLYGGGEVSKVTETGRITNCGVENLRVESVFSSNTDENHAWTAVNLTNVENSWVRQVTAQYIAYGCVGLSGFSKFNTIEECAAIDHKSRITGGRRYSFWINRALGTLFQRCYTRAGRHDFVTNSRTTGPNVWLDSYAEETNSDIGPHHRWAVGSLYDNIQGGEINVRNRGWLGTGHGWVGNSQMLWNNVSSAANVSTGSGARYIVASPQGGRNWAIGVVGPRRSGNGLYESFGTPVMPRSLYLQQLEDRLGPAAVDNIATQEQQNGTIYDDLVAWQGEGSLNSTPAVVSNNIDSYVRDGVHSGTNYANENFLATKSQSSAGFNRFSYIRFNLSEFGNSVATASVRFTVRSRNIPGSRATLHLVNDNIWSDTSLNYDNKPDTNGFITSSSVPSPGGTVSFDITDEVNQALSNGQQTINFRLGSGISSGNDAFVSYHSFEATNASDRPVINATGISGSTNTNIDSYVRDGVHSGTNYSDENFLATKSQSSTGFNRFSYIRFNLSGLGSSVSTASVRFTVRSRNIPGSRATLHLVNDNTWSDTSLNYGNKPDTNGFITSSSVPNPGGTVSFNVTNEVNQALSNGQQTINFRLGSGISSGNNAFVSYHSFEAANASDRPQLTGNTGASLTSRLLNLTVTEEERPQDTSIFVYPNPASEVLHLGNIPNEAIIEVYNIAGILMNSLKGSSDIDVSSLETGVYFLNVFISGKEKQSISFIKR